MQEYFSNFRRYLGNGQRLSIFGREKDGKLEVFILKCNPKDQFSKKIASTVYDSYRLGFVNADNTISIGFSNGIIPNISLGYVTYHPEIVLVPIEEGNTANYQFVLFCKQFYYKVKVAQIVIKDFLIGAIKID